MTYDEFKQARDKQEEKYNEYSEIINRIGDEIAGYRNEISWLIAEYGDGFEDSDRVSSIESNIRGLEIQLNYYLKLREAEGYLVEALYPMHEMARLFAEKEAGEEKEPVVAGNNTYDITDDDMPF